jgi:hypothetical protein
MPATDIQVVTGSDAFILNNLPRRSRSRVPRGTLTDKLVNIPNPSGKEFRLTITIDSRNIGNLASRREASGWSISLARPRRHYQ